MKSVKEIKKEIERIELEVILNTNRKVHFEEAEDIGMVEVYEKLNHVCNAKIEALRWVIGEEE